MGSRERCRSCLSKRKEHRPYRENHKHSVRGPRSCRTSSKPRFPSYLGKLLDPKSLRPAADAIASETRIGATKERTLTTRNPMRCNDLSGVELTGVDPRRVSLWHVRPSMCGVFSKVGSVVASSSQPGCDRVQDLVVVPRHFEALMPTGFVSEPCMFLLPAPTTFWIGPTQLRMARTCSAQSCFE